MIARLPQDQIALEAFAAAFPLKEKPFREDAVNLEGLKLVSRLTPYFNFGKVDADPVYVYGRIESDGLPTALLSGRDLAEGEGGADARKAYIIPG